MSRWLFESGGKGLCAAFTVDGTGDDTACVTGSFTAGIQPLDRHMVKQFIVTGNPQG